MKKRSLLFILTLMIAAGSGYAENAEHPGDSHYNDVGFFDIHLCNWPDRAPFYLAVFSTRQFNDLKSVDLLNARGEQFASLDLSKYKVSHTNDKAEKRIYMSQIQRTANYVDGWFSAKISIAEQDAHTEKLALSTGCCQGLKVFSPRTGMR